MNKMNKKTRRDRFLASLGISLVLSLFTLPWMMLTNPVLSTVDSLAWMAIPGLGIYLLVIAPKPSQGLVVAAAASAVLFLITFMTPDPTLRLLAAPLILGLARSGGLYHRSAARGLALEVCWVLSGLWMAHLFAGVSLLSWGLAVWGFLLTQSLFFLVAELEERRSIEGDPFEQARARALRLMDMS